MYCPKCGQMQVSAEVRFCSHCGFPLIVVGDLLATGGGLPGRTPGQEGVGTSPISPRRRGVKHGIALLLVSILIVPFFAIMHEAIEFPAEFMVLGAVGAMLAILRIIFAVFFQEATPRAPQVASPPPQLYTPPIASRLHAPAQESLPHAQGVPVNDYRRSQANTAEMMRPPSVTENTTRLLDNQTDPLDR
jgi:hypothetical protein